MGAAKIRQLRAPDLVPADELLRAAFGAELSFLPRLHRYLALEPEGWLIAEDEAGATGMVGAINYGAFAYVGMMGVHPRVQRQGLGHQLMVSLLAWLAARGVATALLDATSAGAPLYQRVGFSDAGLSHEMILAAPPPTILPPSPTVRVARDPATLAAIIDLDAQLFGAPRPALWHWLARTPDHPIFVHADTTATIDGYLCVQPQLLGPFAARSADAAHALLASALHLPLTFPLRALAPASNREAQALFTAHGFTTNKAVLHMRRGPALAPSCWEGIYGKGSFCLG